ncbi:MAG: arginine--tRNA ligase [Candidatus Omnitrophota bacterium]
MLGKDLTKKISTILLKACKSYFKKNLPEVMFPENIDPGLQITRDQAHGDLSSNIAMCLASSARKSPLNLGTGIVSVLEELVAVSELKPLISGIELKGGFINFSLSEIYYHTLLFDAFSQKEKFGRSDDGQGEHINLEFVSANPTGPLTVAHGRQAAIGDALSRILRFSGYTVTNEYYLNDIGRQIRLLGESVRIRYRNLFDLNDPMPEDGYMGEYIVDIAEEIKKQKGESLLAQETLKPGSGFFQQYAIDYMMKDIKKDLADFGVNFDVWTSQGRLEKRREVEKVLGVLEKKGWLYDCDGAKWFASTRLGDDKDRVVIKSDGSYTYLAPDIAYHFDKYRRKYTKLIDLLGPDHHGYIKRMKAAVKALGHEAGSLNILIVQLVSLLRNGRTLSMSTRRGEFISLREIMDELGKDVTRFFFLSRRLDSHLDFDIELAKKESSDNPVFYIQYAHARICSIKKYSGKDFNRLFSGKARLNLLSSRQEKQLMRKLSEFPIMVKASADALEPNRIIVYLNELARSFHSFYTECRVVSEDQVLSEARLFLVECVRIVLANGLGLLNITFPEKM